MSFGVRSIARRGYSVRISVLHRPPLRLGLLIGDAVQNLRASLDQLVCRLAELNGSRQIGRNQFPIFSERPSGRRIETWDRMLAGVHPAPAAIIERLQPYNRPDGIEVSRHSLWIVNRLSNEDKHRVVPRALSRVLDPESSPFDAVLRLKPVSDIGAIGKVEFGSLEPDEQQAELYWASVEILGPKPRLKLSGSLPIELVVGEDRISNRRLESAARRVRKVIESFLPFFDGPPPPRRRPIGS